LPDWAVVLGAGVTLVALALPGPGRDSLIYYPYPALTLPAFDTLIGLAILGLLAPAALLLASPPPVRADAVQMARAAGQSAGRAPEGPAAQPAPRSPASWEAIRGVKTNGSAARHDREPLREPTNGRSTWHGIAEPEEAVRGDNGS
jgi:hypothetical protein